MVGKVRFRRRNRRQRAEIGGQKERRRSQTRTTSDRKSRTRGRMRLEKHPAAKQQRCEQSLSQIMVQNSKSRHCSSSLRMMGHSCSGKKRGLIAAGNESEI